MSNLQPSVIGLDKGLNLQTAKILAPSGSVLDTLNYEQVDFQGQKRIDGYVRYDASLGSYIDDYYVATLTDIPQNVTIGNVVLNDGKLMGIVVAANIVPEDSLSFALIDLNQLPESGDVLTTEDGSTIGTVETYVLGSESGITAQQHYNNLLVYNQILRDRVTDLPGPIAGLHWFRDRLYAVASVLRIRLSEETPLLYPNDVLSFSASGTPIAGVILDVQYDADGTRLISIDSEVWDQWTTAGQSVYRVNTGNELVGVTVELVTGDIAELFQSRTEQQAEDELGSFLLYGWDGIHLGWAVPFEEGISLFGSLPSLNQNLQGIGIQGPTNITGTNGSPLALYQKVDIVNRRPQVNGWKGSDSPANYQLNPDNVAGIDGLYIYADAFISWTETSSVVSAPGALSGTLVERSPTAFIELED